MNAALASARESMTALRQRRNYLTYEEVLSALQIEASLIGQKALAKKVNVSLGFMNDVLRGRRMPTDRITKIFGLRKIAVWV